MSHRYETAVMTFRFSSATSPTSTLVAWENKSRVFQTKRWMRSPAIAGQVISGNCKTLWSEPPCYLPVHRCECRWLKFLLTQGSARGSGSNALEQAEREQIVRALRESNWVVGGARGAAARLGLKRTSLAYKMEKLGISRPLQ